MSRRGKITVLTVIFLTIGLFVVNPVLNMRRVAALQDSVGPDATVGINFHEHPWLSAGAIFRILKIARVSDRGSSAEDCGIALLGADLRQVGINDVAPFHAGIAERLSGFRRLESISIVEKADGRAPAKEWSEFIAAMAARRNLRHLVLYGREITDAAVTPLAHHPALQSLTLNSERLTPACLSTLTTLPKMEEFAFLRRMGLSEADWVQCVAGMRKMPRLVTLTIGGEKITDTALAALAGHPTIKNLYIAAASLTPACAATLSSLPSLEYVSIEFSDDPFVAQEQTAVFTGEAQRVFVERFKPRFEVNFETSAARWFE